MSNNLDGIFSSFLKDLKVEDRKNQKEKEKDLIIIKKKLNQLKTIDTFLNKFVDNKILVNHKDQHNLSILDRNMLIPQEFKIYYDDSSDSFAPGQSIFFDHPAEIEISIPNDLNKGIVVISVASDNPHGYLLNKKFKTYEEACIALSKFLLANASINNK